MATGPYRFRVTFEIGYANEPRELEVRTEVVLAYDAVQAVYQVRVAHYKEFLGSARLVESDKPVMRPVMRERKGFTVMKVEPVVEDQGGDPG
jgi:hypothetical protein